MIFSPIMCIALLVTHIVLYFTFEIDEVISLLVPAMSAMVAILFISCTSLLLLNPIETTIVVSRTDDTITLIDRLTCNRLSK